MLSFIPACAPRVPMRPSEAIERVASELQQGEDVGLEARRALFRALADSRVLAFVHFIAEDRCYRVPWEYWQAGGFWDLRLSDRLFAFTDWGVPAELEGKDVVLDGDQVRSLARSVRARATPTTTISASALEDWLRGRDLNVDIERTLWPAAKAHFHDKRVPKRLLTEAVTKITGPRKSGRKPKRATT